MNKTAVLISVLMFYFLACPLAFTDEQITVTAYYPSPYGVYKILRIYPSTGFCSPGASCTTDQEGEICENSSDHNFYICGGNPLAWMRPGYWKPDTNPNNIINTNSGYVKAGPIAIGLTAQNNPTGLAAPALGSDGANIGVLTSGSFQVVDPSVSTYMTVRAADYWMDAPNYGSPRWASQGPQLPSTNCYAIKASRWSAPGCSTQGYYLKGLIKSTDDNWDGYGGICCDSTATPGTSYDDLVADCHAHPGQYGDHSVTCPH